jgi:hypothetical protein
LTPGSSLSGRVEKNVAPLRAAAAATASRDDSESLSPGRIGAASTPASTPAGHEASHCLEPGFWRRCVRLRRARELFRDRADADAHFDIELRQQIDIAHHHRALRDHHEWQRGCDERFERPPGNAVTTLALLVWICGRPECDGLAFAQSAQLARKELGEVDLHIDLAVEAGAVSRPRRA